MDITEHKKKINEVVEQFRTEFGHIVKASISNRQTEQYDLDVIKNTNIRGISAPAMYEIHIFLAPFWTNVNDIDYNVVGMYQRLVQFYNDVFRNSYPYFKNMGAPVLTLLFEGNVEVTVLQSSQYYLSDNIENVIQVLHATADMFASCGFSVIREKLEVMTNATSGIPLKNDDINDVNRLNYFEYHIRIEHTNDSNPNKNVIAMESPEYLAIVDVAKRCEEEFEIKVSLSYNRTPDKSFDGIYYQRYLNLRIKNVGLESANSVADKICEYINSLCIIKVAKIHREYIVYDSYEVLDRGWII